MNRNFHSTSNQHIGKRMPREHILVKSPMFAPQNNGIIAPQIRQGLFQFIVTQTENPIVTQNRTGQRQRELLDKIAGLLLNKSDRSCLIRI